MKTLRYKSFDEWISLGVFFLIAMWAPLTVPLVANFHWWGLLISIVVFPLALTVLFAASRKCREKKNNANAADPN